MLCAAYVCGRWPNYGKNQLGGNQCRKNSSLRNSPKLATWAYPYALDEEKEEPSLVSSFSNYFLSLDDLREAVLTSPALASFLVSYLSRSRAPARIREGPVMVSENGIVISLSRYYPQGRCGNRKKVLMMWDCRKSINLNIFFPSNNLFECG